MKCATRRETKDREKGYSSRKKATISLSVPDRAVFCYRDLVLEKVLRYHSDRKILSVKSKKKIYGGSK